MLTPARSGWLPTRGSSQDCCSRRQDCAPSTLCLSALPRKHAHLIDLCSFGRLPLGLLGGLCFETSPLRRHPGMKVVCGVGKGTAPPTSRSRAARQQRLPPADNEAAGSLELEIGARIRVLASRCPPALFQGLQEWAEQEFVHANPMFEEARQFRRKYKHLEPTIRLHRLIPAAISGRGCDVLEIPRGGGVKIKRWLSENAPGVSVKVVDLRAAPRATGLEALAAAAATQASTATKVATLRGYQDHAVQRAEVLRDGVIVAPTGSGKTVIAMGLVARLGVRALLVVHTSMLMEQMRAAVQAHLGVEAGLLGGGKKDDVREITVATVQTLLRRDEQALRSHFGLVVLDEAHHCPASTFTEVLQRFDARHRVGLTATPTRADGLHPILFDTIGPVLYRVEPSEMVEVGAILAPEVLPIHTSFRGGRGGDRPAMVTALCEDEARNELIAETVAARHRSHSLVLSERVHHCTQLVEALQERGMEAFLLVGQMKAAEREAAVAHFAAGGRGGVLVATTSLLGEGFDCPRMESLFLAVPSGNATRTTQAVGRVLRPCDEHDESLVPRVIDFVDVDTPSLAKTFAARLRVYERHSSTVRPPC